MNFSSSVMSGMGISLGGLEVVTDYLYANSDMYEPELTEIKATISHKPCKPVNRVKPVKPKASTQSIINKFSLIHTDKSKASNNYDEVLDDTSIMVEQSDDFDFSFDDMKTAEEIKQEEREENNALANDLFNRIQNIGKVRQDDVIEQKEQEETDDDFEFDTDEDMEIDPDDDYANEELYDDEEEPDDEDDGIDIDLEELSHISDKKLQEYKEQQAPKPEMQVKQEETQSSNEDDDDDFEFDLGEDSDESEEEEPDDDFEFDLGDDEDDTEDEDADDGDGFEFDLDEDDTEEKKATPASSPSIVKPVVETQDEEDDDFEFDIDDDTEDDTEDDTDDETDDFEFDIDEEEELSAPIQKTQQKVSVSQQSKQIIEQPKQESKAVVKQPEVAVKQGPTETELEMSRKIKQLEEQIQRLSSSQAPVQASNVVSKDIKKDSNFSRVTAKQQTVNQAVSTKPVTNYDRYSAMQIDILYREVREFIIQRGVREKLVDIAELHEKFGEPNIRKLINKSYIIRIGKGVTTGR